MPARDLARQAPFVRDDDDEGLFSRDINGQLVRLDAPTESDYGAQVSLQIDGRAVTVPLAEPAKDAQGNIIIDLAGRTTPRYTTIYDAAVKAYEAHRGARETRSDRPEPSAPSPQGSGDAATPPASSPDWREFPIPVLCHQPHMTPVAVCRLCVVQIYGQRDGKRTPERKLLPACQHHVKNGMEVFTMDAPGPDGDRVRRAVQVLTELLTAEHLKPAGSQGLARELEPFNELKRAEDRCGLQGSRFKAELFSAPTPASVHSTLDDSSPVFSVDHSACILCDRCSRACNDVKQNFVIGRTGKGARTRIGFDLDVPMGRSTCVQCGECMVSCPTSAITFKPVARIQAPAGARNVEWLAAAEMARDPLFSGVPAKFLLWQEGLVVRRRVKAGERLCRQGEPGNRAFVIKTGRFDVITQPQAAEQPRGILGRLIAENKRPQPPARFERGPEDLIVGEMACLSGTPRTADVVALQDGEVWEVRRNVLDRIMRLPTLRERFEHTYRQRTLELVLGNSGVFQDLPPDVYARVVDFLKPRLSFVRVSPGQMIFQQGDVADNLYLVRLGHVRVRVSQAGREVTVFYRGPGTVIGEIGLLAISPQNAWTTLDQIDRRLEDTLRHCDPAGLSAALPAGKRTATCSALDHLEMARIGRDDVLEMVKQFPPVRRRLIGLALDRTKETARADRSPVVSATRRDYLEHGLYQGRSLLVLDLERCTRCDQCTKACIEQHGIESHGVPITRLVRQGVRFGDYLVTTSCRSCKDAYCMIGCPVDAIHRGKHLQIIIEDHCIGCGLCATNCPYGNIFMIPNERPSGGPDAEQAGQNPWVAQPKAATCDLCDAEGRLDKPMPRCVYACPHEAAIRMTGEELLERVTRRLDVGSRGSSRS